MAASVKLSRVAALAAVLSLVVPSTAAPFNGWAPAHNAFDPRAKQTLARFFNDTGPQESGISRDGKPTHGNPFAKGASGGPLLPVERLALPRQVWAQGKIPGFVRFRDRASGWLVIACTGTGCAYRVPVIYTDAMLESVRLAMATAMGDVEARDADAEIRGLEAAAFQMEKLLAAKLVTLTNGELEAYRVKGVSRDPWTQDCVDQSANGTSYAIVWAEEGMMRFHTPYYPGFKGGLRPHFYSRLQRNNDGGVLAFDLFHREDGIGKGSPILIGPDPKNGA